MQRDEHERINKRLGIALVTLCINLAVTLGIVVYIATSGGHSPNSDGILDFDNINQEQYIMYIGTNDKDNYEQLIPTDEAREIINAICEKHVEGWTSSDAKGGWIDEKGVLTQEATLIYTFNNVEEAQVIAIMDEILTTLNQNSILLERRDVTSMFYRGMR